jgi:hypothetical protein
MQHLLTHVEVMRYHDEADETERALLAERYQTRLRTMEVEAQQKVEQIWNHKHTEKEQAALLFDGMDLFSRKSASIFGLSRQEMVMAGAAGGAATGAGIDLLFAGHTLLLGGVIGALVGGAGAWWGFDELSEIRVMGTALGHRTIEMGPMTNRNFPWIVLGRFLYHAHTLALRSHAVRGTIALQMDETFKDKWLDDPLRDALEQCHKAFRSDKEVTHKTINEYEKLIEKALRKVII